MVKDEVIYLDDGNKISINVIVDDKEVYDLLSDKTPEERIDLIKRSIKIGIMALKNATITVDTNYVQKEIERLVTDLDNNLKKNLGMEGMKGELEKTFGENGYLENSLKEMFKEHDKTIADIFREDNINSPLYKIRRFMEENSRQSSDKIYDMLDPGNKDSLLSRLKEDIVKKIDEVKKSGNMDAVNKSIEAVKLDNRSNNDAIRKDIQGVKDDYNNKFTDMRKSLHEEVGGVKDAVGGIKDAVGGIKDAVGGVKDMVAGTNTELAKLVKEKQVVDVTTLKGMKFEDILYRFLSTRALAKYGDTIDVVNLCGGDKAGDIIINVNGSQEKIIVKAESTSKENVQMPDTILKHLNSTMKERGAEYGIKVYENELPDQIGPILIGDGKIICSYLRGYTFEGYPLEVAYEILRTSILRKSLGINKEDIKQHIDNIIRFMSSLQHISGNLSKMENLCENTKAQIESLRSNVSSELDQILMKGNGGVEVDKKEKSRKRKLEPPPKEKPPYTAAPLDQTS